jgi:hypothetical protein
MPATDGDPLGQTMALVLEVMRAAGRPLTDEELCDATNLRGGAARPARLRLYRRGLVEPCGSGGWRLVEPERHEEVRSAARTRMPRRRAVDSMPLEERVATVIALLDDDEVNAALIARTESSRAWRRARARAGEMRAEREHERRARRVAAMQAERRHSPLTAFLKMRNHLKDGIEVLVGLRRLLVEEAAGESGTIPRAVWPDLARNVGELMTAAAAVQAELDGVAGSGECPLCHGAAPAEGTLAYIDVDCIDLPVAGAA